MRKTTMLTLIMAVILLAVTLASFPDTLNVNAQQVGFKAHPLISASKTEVEQAALEYTQARFRILSLSVTFPLTRRVTRQDLSKLGIEVVDLAGEPPLMLVALKGDFIVTPRSGLGNISWHTNHIIYVFDLRLGGPTHISTHTDSKELDKIINAAASLPEPAPPTTVQPLNTTPVPTAIRPTQVAPTRK